MHTTHETLHSDKWSLVYLKIMDIPTSFIWIVNLFNEAFKCGDGGKFWGYAGINAEPLCVELCNFVQCHAFVNYLTSYYILYNCFQLAWQRHNSESQFNFMAFFQSVLSISGINTATEKYSRLCTNLFTLLIYNRILEKH
jgi:hypothetical protein